MIGNSNGSVHKSQTVMNRKCGDCSICCKLLPMKAGLDDGMRMLVAPDAIADFNKAAGERCPHQRHGKGCSVYQRRPCGCRLWSCHWLTGNDTADQRRPDRSHVVMDPMPDFIRCYDTPDQQETIQVCQLWCDPGYRDAYKAPEVRAWMQRRALEGFPTLVRFSSSDGVVVFAPELTGTGEWVERGGPAAGQFGSTWPTGLHPLALEGT